MLPLDMLTDAFRAWIEKQGLQQLDAMELLHEDLTDYQRRFVTAFVTMWEKS